MDLSMAKYVVGRLISLLPVLLVVGVTSFLLIHLTPGDPAAAMLGPAATTEQIEELRHQMGLDKPLLMQFIVWIGGVLRGDLGTSYYLARPVLTVINDRIPVTLTLAIAAQILALGIALPAGILSAIKQNSLWDRGAMIVALLGVSMPNFWLALNLVLLFAVAIPWFPVQGYVALNEGLWDSLRHLFLPAVSLGFMQAALIARMTRSSMLDVLRSDFVRTARAKGLAERIVINKHALKNAINPILTAAGVSFVVLLGGAVVIETVFGYPGVGRLVVDSVMRRDYPVIQGAVLYIAAMNVFVNLVVDIMYVYFDPRLRYE